MTRATEGGLGEMALAQLRRLILPACIFLALLVFWQIWVVTQKVPEAILPTPLVILDTIILRIKLLINHTWPTMRECLIGFLMSVGVGVSLGILLALSRFFRNGIYPLIIAFQVVPKVALAPLFIVWFGLGSMSRTLLAFVIAFFPMVVNTYAGIESTDPVMVRMARAFSASRWQIFRKIEFPNALPYIFSGLRIGITFSVIGIIVAEFVTAQEGLGYLIIFSEGNVDTPMLMAALTILSLVGIILYGLLSFLLQVSRRLARPLLDGFLVLTGLKLGV
ncbi:MAG: ABC transporter permease, partial [Nitrospinota bacterium]|nr:ABC transporter permease [Nitrospinota bacterium]